MSVMIPLGFVGNDFVSGLAKLDDIGKTISGEQAVAMYQIEIRSDADKVIKTYSSDGYYILSTEIDDGMITLNRVQKNGDTYTSAAANYISSNQEKKESNIMLESYVTDLKETQMRLDLCGWHQGQICKSIEAETGCTGRSSITVLLVKK